MDTLNRDMSDVQHNIHLQPAPNYVNRLQNAPYAMAITPPTTKAVKSINTFKSFTIQIQELITLLKTTLNLM